MLARWSKTDYPASRIALVADRIQSPNSGRRWLFRKPVRDIGVLIFWRHFDDYLRDGFGLE